MPLSIPIVGGAFNAHHEFSVQLGSNFLDFRMDYKTSLDQWSINISKSGTLLVAGAMLEPNCDIIQTWNLTETIGKLVCITENGDNPNLTNIGGNIQLLWYSPEELGFD